MDKAKEETMTDKPLFKDLKNYPPQGAWQCDNCFNLHIVEHSHDRENEVCEICHSGNYRLTKWYQDVIVLDAVKELTARLLQLKKSMLAFVPLFEEALCCCDSINSYTEHDDYCQAKNLHDCIEEELDELLAELKP